MPEKDPVEGVVEVAVAIAVSDMDRALEFYCDGLGFELVHDEEDPGQDRRRATLRFGNAVLDLALGETPARRPAHRLLWTVEVAKMRAALDLIVDLGGSVVRTMEYGIFCADPDGNTLLLKLMEPPEQEQFW